MVFPLSLKKIFWLFILGFLIFFVLKNPVEAGEIVKNIAQWINDFFIEGARAFSEFMRTVF